MAQLLRVAPGCALAVLVCGSLIAAAGLPAVTGWALVAPFGASALLVLVVPNSPLAQPWPLIVGSLVPALVGIAVAQLGLPVIPAAAVALGLAVAAMILLRAVHPPGGAVALIPVLAEPASLSEGLRLALLVVGPESVLLLAFALLWHRATGRVYPLRQPDEVPRAAIRFGREELAAILERLRLSANIGVADFARLLAAADQISTADDRVAGLTCLDAAGPPKPPLAPGDGLAAARAQMLGCGAYTLPVTDPAGLLLGVLSQSDLLRMAAAPPETTVAAAMTAAPVTLGAGDSLQQGLGTLVAGGWRAVPLVDGQGRCLGMLSRADLLAVLARPLAPGGIGAGRENPLHGGAAAARSAP